jgi:hypothetical protein
MKRIIIGTIILIYCLFGLIRTVVVVSSGKITQNMLEGYNLVKGYSRLRPFYLEEKNDIILNAVKPFSIIIILSLLLIIFGIKSILKSNLIKKELIALSGIHHEIDIKLLTIKAKPKLVNKIFIKLQKNKMIQENVLLKY